VGKGGEVAIPVGLSGRLAREAHVMLRAAGDRAPVRQRMQRVGKDRFLFMLYDVTDDRYFRIRAGDAETVEHHLRVVEPPRVEELIVTVRYPDYTKLPPLTVRDAPEVAVLEGSDVELRFRCGQALQSAQLVLSLADGNQSTAELRFTNGVAAHRVAAFSQDTAFRAKLRNREAFDNLDRDERRLSLVKDQPPKLQIVSEQEVLTMFPTELRTFPVQAADDLGLTALTMTLVKNPDPDAIVEPTRVPMTEFDPPVKDTQQELALNLETLGVEPGDVLEVRVEGKDSNRSYGLSNRLLIQVVPFEPGLEEQQRIHALRLYAALLGECARVEGDAGPGTGLGADAVQRLTVLGQRLGIEVPPLTGDPLPLLTRLLVEQDLTPFHAHKHDLRQTAWILGCALLTERGRAGRRADFEALSRDILPAQVQFRFHRNLLRVLFALREELARARQAPAAAAAATQKRLAQLQLSVQKWMSLLAETARESPRAAGGFEAFAADVEAVNTAAFVVRASSGPSLAALDAGLEKLQRKVEGLLPALLEEILRQRRAAEERAEAARGSLFGSLESPDPADRLGELVRRTQASLDHDPAVAPEERLTAYLLGRAVEPGAEARLHAALRAMAGLRAAYVERSGILYRELSLEALERSIRVDRSLGEALRTYDLEFFRREHDRWLGTDPRAADRLAAAFSGLAEAREPFVAALRTNLPPATAELAGLAGRVVGEQRALRAALEAALRGLDTGAAAGTVETRRTILERCDRLTAAAAQMQAHLRLLLTVEPAEVPPPGEHFVRGWTRVLVRFHERLQHFESGSAQTLEVLRGAAGRELDAVELSLLQPRLNLMLGANGGIQKLCETLEPARGKADPGADFFAAEAARLSLAGDIERLQATRYQLRQVPADDALQARAAVLRVLGDHEAIQDRLLAETLAPRSAEALRACREVSRASQGLLTAGSTNAAAAAEVRQRAAAVRETLAGMRGLLAELSGEVAERYRAGLDEALGRLDRAAGRGGAAAPGLSVTALESVAALEALERTDAQIQRAVAGGLAVVPPPRLEMAARAAFEARRQFDGAINGWQMAALRQAMAYLADGDAGRLARAAHHWQAAINLTLSPVVLADPKAILVESRGREIQQRRHWIVEEFQRHLRLPLPRLHRTETKEYYDRLREGFREHEHTR
jgi:hypothetical protein